MPPILRKAAIGLKAVEGCSLSMHSTISTINDPSDDPNHLEL